MGRCVAFGPGMTAGAGEAERLVEIVAGALDRRPRRGFSPDAGAVQPDPAALPSVPPPAVTRAFTAN